MAIRKRTVLSWVLSAWLAGCGGDDPSPSPAGPAAQEALPESLLVAAWRTEMTTPSGIVRIYLHVDSGHTLDAVVQKKTAVPGADSAFMEVQRERMTWALEADGQLTTTKTDCKYADPGSGALVAKDCTAPITDRYPVAVDAGGTRLTTVRNGTLPITFLRQ